jgi:hypothetical protein
MAPSTIAVTPEAPTATITKAAGAVNTLPAPLPAPAEESKLLSHPHHDSTPAIGTEFATGFQVSSLLGSPDQVRDLASLVSRRGVVFFRNQDITPAQQRELVHALGELSGKPKSSGLHVHPITKENGKDGDEISIISSVDRLQYDKARRENARAAERWGWDKGESTQLGSRGWVCAIVCETES